MAQPTAPPTADSLEAIRVLCDFRAAQKKYLRLIAAGKGPTDLISELPIYVIEMVEALAEAAGSHPELLAETARDHVAWPVMAARHCPQGPEFAALAERIELGANVVVSLSPHARYRWDTPLNRLLFQILHHGFLEVGESFYFLNRPEHYPKLTGRSLPWFLDEHLMPLLDELRTKHGSWGGLPAIATLVVGVAGAAAQRRIVRQQIKQALHEFAGPEEEVA